MTGTCLFVLRSKREQRAFVARALDQLERLGEHKTHLDASTAMQIAYQIEREAMDLELRLLANSARSLSTQAAELYLRSDGALPPSTLKAGIDVVTILLLRVYLAGTDAESTRTSLVDARPHDDLHADEPCVH